jgi:hypothetical protein
MSARVKRYRFDLLDMQDPQIRPPAMKSEEGIVVGGEVLGQRLP